jgi:hypothetical protein
MTNKNEDNSAKLEKLTNIETRNLQSSPNVMRPQETLKDKLGD